MHFLDVAAAIADELFAGGEIDPRIGAETRRNFFLAVIELVNLGPFRPWVVGLPGIRRARQDF